jgi:hypothetical protein
VNATVTRVNARNCAGYIVLDTDHLDETGFPMFAGKRHGFVLVKDLKAEITRLAAAGFTIAAAH